ncbi:MAG: nucleotidyltransferase domain-containing protein [Bacillota bacterium]
MRAFRKKHSLVNKNKSEIISLLTESLKHYTELEFAYIHGSFLNEEQFGDIDIAVYLKEGASLPKDSITKLEIDLEVQLEKIVRYPLDIRVINYSPLSFRYNVLKGGKLLFARNEDILTNFTEKTISAYIDFVHYRKRYLKEVLNLEV